MYIIQSVESFIVEVGEEGVGATLYLYVAPLPGRSRPPPPQTSVRHLLTGHWAAPGPPASAGAGETWGRSWSNSRRMSRSRSRSNS